MITLQAGALRDRCARFKSMQHSSIAKSIDTEQFNLAEARTTRDGPQMVPGGGNIHAEGPVVASYSDLKVCV